MFEARLQVAFCGVPGEQKVREQEYFVLTHNHRIIDPQYWTDLVLPRSKLRMFVVLFETREDRVCAQPECRARVTQGQPVRDGGVMVIWYVIAASYSITSLCSLPTYSPKCDTTSYIRNVSEPIYSDPRNMSRPILDFHFEWIQERFKAIKSRYREGKKSRGPEENEIRFFKNILISNSLVWNTGQVLDDTQTAFLTALARFQNDELISFLGEIKSLTENLIGSRLGLSLQYMKVLRSLDGLPAHEIATWLAYERSNRV